MALKFNSIGLVVRQDMQARHESIQRVIDVLERHATVRVHFLEFDANTREFSNLGLDQLVDAVVRGVPGKVTLDRGRGRGYLAGLTFEGAS